MSPHGFGPVTWLVVGLVVWLIVGVWSDRDRTPPWGY